jgi:hypothetical protein
MRSGGHFLFELAPFSHSALKKSPRRAPVLDIEEAYSVVIYAPEGLQDSAQGEWREDKELLGRFLPRGWLQDSAQGFNPGNPQNKRVRPEGARG